MRLNYTPAPTPLSIPEFCLFFATNLCKVRQGWKRGKKGTFVFACGEGVTPADFCACINTYPGGGWWGTPAMARARPNGMQSSICARQKSQSAQGFFARPRVQSTRRGTRLRAKHARLLSMWHGRAGCLARTSSNRAALHICL